MCKNNLLFIPGVVVTEKATQNNAVQEKGPALRVRSCGPMARLDKYRENLKDQFCHMICSFLYLL
jgi:hypothetical protein